MRNSRPRVDVRTSCKMSAICKELCRGCGVTAAKKDRRVMCSDASSGIVQVWQEIVEKTLHQLGKDVLVDPQGEERISYLCRKCYGSLEKYKKLQASLVSNMEKAINARESVTSWKRPRMEASDDEIHGERAKQPRLDPSVSAPPSRVRKQLVYPSASLPESSGCQSPAVTVCLYNILFSLQTTMEKECHWKSGFALWLALGHR